ncbi:MAG: tRNA dihydrouridine(20/20a) synthase DusA [Calditrichota bacterium]
MSSNTSNSLNDRRGQIQPLSVAPMMDRSDRHYRVFMRKITRQTLLYTEMRTTGAILKGDRDKVLGYSEEEKPLALQVGGDDPKDLAACAKIAEDWGYDEVNINVGCPSDRVQQGHFGACLMADPPLVERCVAAMRKATTLPVTVKHRIGINGLESYESLANFVGTVARAGCDRFSVHARIAVLGGLNPKQNRTIPPLRYDDIYRLKREYPGLIIEINGGIKTLDEAAVHLLETDGVMIGRAAYDNPYLFALADSQFYGSDSPIPTRREVLEAMVPYLDKRLTKGDVLTRLVRHMQGLFSHQPGNKAWKQFLGKRAPNDDADARILLEAMEHLPDEVLDLQPAETA